MLQEVSNNLRKEHSKLSNVTYGIALATADSLLKGDMAGVKLAHETMGLGVIVASTFQLSVLLLKVAPRGKWSDGEDLRPQVDVAFDEALEELIPFYYDQFDLDEKTFRTVITTIVMASFVPFLEGGEAIVSYPDYEELNEWQMMGVFAVIAAAMVNAFTQVMPLLSTDHKLGMVDVRRILLVEEETV